MENAERFVLCRWNWAWSDWSRYPMGWLHRLHGFVSLESFETFEKAEAERVRLEEKIRKDINPFDCGLALPELTHLGELPFRDWLLDHDITPVDEGGIIEDWRAWWVQHRRDWSTNQVAAVWEGLNKVRFYFVEARPKRPVVYVVVAINWQYNDDFMYRFPGGEPLAAYRSKRNAEHAWLAATEAACQADWRSPQFEVPEPSPDRVFWRDTDLSLDYEKVRSRNANETPFYEIVEVELEEGET